MNKLIEATNQTPIEIALQIDENGMTTARKLYEFLELAKGQFARWAKTNIEEETFYEEGFDWIGFDIMSSGNKVKDYKLTIEFAKHLCMLSRSEKGKIARKYFIKVEDKLKEIAISEQHLSPELQMFKQIFNAVAKQEAEVKRIEAQSQQAAEQSKQAVEVTQNIKNTIVGTYDDWRDWVKQTVSKIQKESGMTYQDVYSTMYDQLEKRAKCRLSVRVDNQRKRMALDGAAKTKIESYRTLDVIADDQRLKEIFSTIVKEYAIKYVA